MRAIRSAPDLAQQQSSPEPGPFCNRRLAWRPAQPRRRHLWPPSSTAQSPTHSSYGYSVPLVAAARCYVVLAPAPGTAVVQRHLLQALVTLVSQHRQAPTRSLDKRVSRPGYFTRLRASPRAHLSKSLQERDTRDRTGHGGDLTCIRCSPGAHQLPASPGCLVLI